MFQNRPAKVHTATTNIIKMDCIPRPVPTPAVARQGIHPVVVWGCIDGKSWFVIRSALGIDKMYADMSYTMLTELREHEIFQKSKKGGTKVKERGNQSKRKGERTGCAAAVIPHWRLRYHWYSKCCCPHVLPKKSCVTGRKTHYVSVHSSH